MSPPSARRAPGGEWRAALGVVLIAVAYVVAVAWPRARNNPGAPNFDTYTAFVPSMTYALDALHGGSGLLWNRLQNCGQPFFAVILTALAYPLHAVLLAVDLDLALHVLFAAHLAIGGLGAYLLGRALGTSPWAALCAALTFQLAYTTLSLAYWSPINLAAYAWMPVALGLCERLLRQPSGRRAAWLAAALAVQLLAGFPQVAVMTYQLLALRLLWAGVTAWPGARRGIALGVAALLLAPGLAAVQLLPALELVAESVRGRALQGAEMASLLRTPTWGTYRAGGLPLLGLAPLALAAAAWGRREGRRMATFFALVAVGFGALAFESPLLDLYRRLPLGSTFRGPERFLWVTAVCLIPLAALGAEALRARPARRGVAAPALLPMWAMLIAVSALTAPAVLWQLGAIGMGMTAGALLAARGWPTALRVVVPLLIAVPCLAAPHFFTYQPDHAFLYAARPVFAAARARMTAGDRMYQIAMPIPVARAGILGPSINPVIKKAGMLFGLPSIIDYEPQMSERYARYVVRMLHGRPMRSLNDVYFDLRWVPRAEPLLHLTAARFIIVDDAQQARLEWPAGDTYALVWQQDGYRLYENRRALPRARYVPQLERVADPAAVLERLASPAHDPRRVALVEGAPGLDGTAGGSGSAEIVADTSERLTIRVQATAPGYLALADQYYPGWEASVNGRPAAIARADYAFRAVAVPAGGSLVEFRYRPRSLLAGGLGSALSLLLLVALARRHEP